LLKFINPPLLAGQPAPRERLVNVPRLVSAYYTTHPDPADPLQGVSFGTSGHRGTSAAGSFNDDHIAAIAQAIADYRAGRGIDGPLYAGMDTHALSEPALATAVEVFAANGVRVVIQSGLGYTPTPVISHAILTHNRARPRGLADGVVITPSHNPAEDGGFKYNPPRAARPTPTITSWIQDRANALLADALRGVQAHDAAPGAGRRHDGGATTTSPPTSPTWPPWWTWTPSPPPGCASASIRWAAPAVHYWAPIAERYGSTWTVVNPYVDPTFGFMTVDHDGKIRMDCSSPYAMASLIRLKDDFDIAFGNDPDFDRHGIVTRSAGLMNPNHFLAVAIWYLFQNRPAWRADAAVGKTLVSSSMIDRVAAHLGRRLAEVPVGFKWFVDGLLSGEYGFGGEESAGASFLRRDGTVWTTDKDGFIMDLLAAEIMARTGRDPGEQYRELAERFGDPVYERADTPVSTRRSKAVLGKLTPELVTGQPRWPASRSSPS
jgi:phosphoglucomutase